MLTISFLGLSKAILQGVRTLFIFFIPLYFVMKTGGYSDDDLIKYKKHFLKVVFWVQFLVNAWFTKDRSRATNNDFRF